MRKIRTSSATRCGEKCSRKTAGFATNGSATASDLPGTISPSWSRGSGFALGGNQEAFLISGTYHSGPLTTIRFVGVVGVAFLSAAHDLSGSALHRLIRECSGTRLFPVALFVGMPVVFALFPYVFVAGMFDVNLTESLFAAGLLRVLCKALKWKRPR